jgi:hypothetical protein
VVDPGSPLIGLRPDEISVVDGRMFRTGEPSRGESHQELLRRRDGIPLTPSRIGHQAIANAVFNATGKRVTDLPITLDKLL